jgi:aspartate/methionine/tyrosine aminotransferase
MIPVHIEYLEWIIGLGWEPCFNLGTSEPQLDARPQDFGLGPEDMLINGSNALGYDDLRESLAKRYGVAAENVLCTLGASGANFLLCAILLDPGDEVIVERPAYEPLVKVPQLFGAIVRRLERRFQDGFGLDPGDVRKLLTKRTKLVLISNLHNPSGTLLSQEVLKEVGDLAASVGAYVLVDEIYLEFLFEQTPRSSFHLGESILVTSSLTKVYGLGGLRLGWALCPPDLVSRAQRLYFAMGVHNPICAEVIGHRLLSRPQVWERWVAAVRQRICENRPLVDAFLQQRDDLEWVRPAGGVMVYPRIRGDFNSQQLAELLRQRYDTFIIPGHFFEDDRHFRLSFGAPGHILQQGLKNVTSALDQLGDGRCDECPR